MRLKKYTNGMTTCQKNGLLNTLSVCHQHSQNSGGFHVVSGCQTLADTMCQIRVLYIALMVLMVLLNLRRTFSDKSDGIANVMTNTMNRLARCSHGCHCQNHTKRRVRNE